MFFIGSPNEPRKLGVEYLMESLFKMGVEVEDD